MTQKYLVWLLKNHANEAYIGAVYEYSLISPQMIMNIVKSKCQRVLLSV